MLTASCRGCVCIMHAKKRGKIRRRIEKASSLFLWVPESDSRHDLGFSDLEESVKQTSIGRYICMRCHD